MSSVEEAREWCGPGRLGFPLALGPLAPAPAPGPSPEETSGPHNEVSAPSCISERSPLLRRCADGAIESISRLTSRAPAPLLLLVLPAPPCRWSTCGLERLDAEEEEDKEEGLREPPFPPEERENSNDMRMFSIALGSVSGASTRTVYSSGPMASAASAAAEGLRETTCSSVRAASTCKTLRDLSLMESTSNPVMPPRTSISTAPCTWRTSASSAWITVARASVYTQIVCRPTAARTGSSRSGRNDCAAIDAAAAAAAGSLMSDR